MISGLFAIRYNDSFRVFQRYISGENKKDSFNKRKILQILHIYFNITWIKIMGIQNVLFNRFERWVL